jgi:hypothetical protein
MQLLQFLPELKKRSIEVLQLYDIQLPQIHFFQVIPVGIQAFTIRLP